MVEKPEVSPICGKNPAHAEIRVHKICVFLGRTVHTHGRITGWGKLLKKKPPPFRITKRVSELFRKTENAVVPFRKRGMSNKTVVAGEKWATERVLRYYDDYMIRYYNCLRIISASVMAAFLNSSQDV